jgi:hypothetical protein
MGQRAEVSRRRGQDRIASLRDRGDTSERPLFRTLRCELRAGEDSRGRSYPTRTLSCCASRVSQETAHYSRGFLLPTRSSLGRLTRPMSSPVLRVACAVLQSRTESAVRIASLRFYDGAGPFTMALAPATAKPNLSNNEESRSLGSRPPAYTGPRSDVRRQEHCAKSRVRRLRSESRP